MNDKAGFSGLKITGNLGHLLNNICGKIMYINKYMNLAKEKSASKYNIRI